MNIKDLEYFKTVCDYKSIAKAARALYLTPQGLSRIIKNVEAELNTQLLIRTASGIRLTETGQYLYGKLPGALIAYEAVCNDIRCIEQNKHHEIDLISAYGILRLVTPECLIDFQKKYPHIKVIYREFPDREVERRWERGCGNVAFLVGNSLIKFPDAVPMERFPLSLLVHKSHPLSSKTSASILDLKDEPLYIESSEFNIHHLIVEKCRKAGFEPNLVFTPSGFSLCHKMVAQNKGISVTVDFIFDDMHSSNLVKIPFHDDAFYWETNVLVRKGSIKNPDVEIFSRHVIDWIQAIQMNRFLR